MTTADYVLMLTVCLACCVVCTVGFPYQELQEYDTPQYRTTDVDPNPDLRKLLLLKKLRFREILKDNMFSPDELLESTKDESDNDEKSHKTSKRHKVDDLISHVRALLSDIKERQIKESMSLPSLRFGRSSFNYKH